MGIRLPMRVIATLALPRVDRDYAAERRAMQMAVIGGSDAGPVGHRDEMASVQDPRVVR